MANPIVIVLVSQTVGPTPNNLQKTGALISQGGTTLGVGQYSLLTQPSDLTPLLAAPLAITSLSWANTYGGEVTATATSNHGIATGEAFVTTIAGANQSAYNGTFNCIATGAATFTYYLSTNPGTTPATGTITYTPRNVAEVQAMTNTFFSQVNGFSQSVYVLELGAGEASTGITNLTSFINNSPQKFYGYLVPRNWDGTSAYLSFLANFEAPNAKTYFWTTTTLQNWQLYTSSMKDVIAMIEAPFYGVWPSNAFSAASWSGGIVSATTTTPHGVIPGQYFTVTGNSPAGYNGTFVALPGTTGSTLMYAVAATLGSNTVLGTLQPSLYSSPQLPATEFSAAAAFQVAISYAPSTTNLVSPYEYSFLLGVTQFPQQGNSAILTTLKAGNINYVGFGGEGGISDTMLEGGNTMDGNPFNYWYSADWMQINLDLNISNAIINGSNNRGNPLYYNQNGIDRLNNVQASTAASSIAFGMALGRVIMTNLDAQTFQTNVNLGLYAGNVVVNAQPFTSYSAVNPGDYKIGKYGGLSVAFTPLRGFNQIIVNLNVTSFAA